MKAKLQPLIIFMILWLTLNLIPYAVIGEYWGMVWMYLNAPISFLVEDFVGIGDDSYVLIFFSTLVQSLLIYSIVYLIFRISQMFYLKAQKESE